MFGTHFYHERVRKCVAVFGAMFNNLYIIRRDGNNVYAQQKVPLAYAPARKFLERINEMNNGEDNERQLAIKLPRMSFEVLAIAYDPQRQLPKTNYFTKQHIDDNTSGAKFYTGTPYIITFELNVYAKQHNDALQVVEQILPYFAPQYTVNFKPIEDYPDIKEDVPVILQSVAFTDNFEGAMEDRRTIIYTLTFDMKINFYGPKPSTGPLITRVDADLFNMDVNSLDSDRYLETVRTETSARPVSPDSDYTIQKDVLDSDSPVSLPHAYE
jgi:hypothetical protein